MKSQTLLIILLSFPFSLLALPHTDSDLPADARVTWGTLDNGLVYAVMPNAEPPGKVSLRLLVEAGSIMEDDDQQGLAHFLEHMAFNGSENYPPGELIEYLQRIGMSFGADTNAHTGFDETVYKLELPAASEAMLREGFQVLADYAGGLLLLDEEIEKERGVILSELRDRDTIDYRTFVAYWTFLFPDSLIPQRLPIGKQEVIKFAGRPEFLRFYQDWYRPDNMALIVVGDIQAPEVEPLIREYFASLKTPAAAIREVDLGKVSEVKLRTKLHSEPEAPATEIGLITIRPFDNDGDSRDARLADIRMAAANRILSRRLDKLAKAEDAPFSEGSAYAFDYLDFFEMGGIEITCRPEQWQQALTVAEQELRRALEHGFTEAEVAEVKANLLKGYELAVEQAPTRRHRQLSSALMRSLTRDDVFTSPETNLELARSAMADYGPTEAITALRELWQDDGRYVFISGNLTLGEDDPTIEEIYTASQAVVVEPPEKAEAKTWSYTDFGKPGQVVSEDHIKDLDIHQLRFANNVRFNFKQTDFEAGTVQVLARFGGGRLAEPEDQYGISLFASMVFTAGGLEKLSDDEIKQVLAGRHVGAGFSVGEDAFTLAGATTPDDLKTQLQLMAAYLTAPGYREEAARLARQAYAEQALRIEQTLEGVIGNRVDKFLADDSRFFGYPGKQQFDAFTMAAVKAWLRDPLANASLEISIVGDIDYILAKRFVAETFGALPKRAAVPAAYTTERDSVHFPKVSSEKTFTYPTDLPRAAAAVYWPTADFWDIQRTRRLNVLSRIFADRLRIEVREKLGEGYSPYARNISSETFKDYGYLFAINLCDPERTDELTAMLAGLGNTLGEGNITADELDRSIKPIMTMLKDYLRTNAYWLSRVLSRSQEKPQQLDWARSIESDYAAITVDELNAIAKEYLGASDGLQVSIKPTAD